MESNNNKQKKQKRLIEKIGTVVKRKMQKTAVVAIERIVPHPLYMKRIKKIKKVYAHDEQELTSPGDVVLIRETRPISKLKRWIVVKIIKKAESVQPESENKELPTE